MPLPELPASRRRYLQVGPPSPRPSGRSTPSLKDRIISRQSKSGKSERNNSREPELPSSHDRHLQAEPSSPIPQSRSTPSLNDRTISWQSKSGESEHNDTRELPAPTRSQQPPPRRSRWLRAVEQKPVSAWGRWARAMDTDILAAIEKDAKKAAQEVVHEQYKREMTRLRKRAVARWQRLRDWIFTEFAKDRWRRIIDRAALRRLREQREQERAAREAAAIAEAARQRVMQAEDRIRCLAHKVERRRVAGMRELVLKQRLEQERERQEALLAKQRELELAKELERREAERQAQLAAAKLEQLEYERAMLERLQAAKKKRPATVDPSVWLKAQQPDFVAWSAWPPMRRADREKLAADSKSTEADHDACINGHFADGNAVRPITPIVPPPRNTITPPRRDPVGRQELSAAQPLNATPLWPPELMRATPRTPESTRRTMIAKAGVGLGADLPYATHTTVTPVRIARIGRRGQSMRELHPVNRPVKGTVPFYAPGLLMPVPPPSPTRHMRPRGSTGDSTRYLSNTMNGGPPHLLPILKATDLSAVLDMAGVDFRKWDDGLFRQLLDELVSLEAVVFSVQQQESVSTQAQLDISTNTPPLNSHVILKRNVLYVHVLSDCGRYELMQTIYDAGRVEHRRICARLTDRMSPASVAVALVSEALGVAEDAVNQLDALPIVSQSGSSACAYPGISCEHIFYVLRLGVEGLPPHGFRSQRMEWTWRSAAVSRPPSRMRLSPRPSLSGSAVNLGRLQSSVSLPEF